MLTEIESCKCGQVWRWSTSEPCPITKEEGCPACSEKGLNALSERDRLLTLNALGSMIRIERTP